MTRARAKPDRLALTLPAHSILLRPSLRRSVALLTALNLTTALCAPAWAYDPGKISPGTVLGNSGTGKASPIPIPMRLRSGVQFYVDRATGSDTNNNCTNPAAKCLTVKHATQVALQHDSYGQYLIINFDGVHPEPLVFSGSVTGSGTFPAGNSSSLSGTLYLNGVSPTTSKIAPRVATGCLPFGGAIVATSGFFLALKNLEVSTDCPGGDGLDSESNSFIETIEGVVINSSTGCHARSENNGVISVVGSSLTVKGTSVGVLCVSIGGRIEAQPNAAITCEGPLTYTNGFAIAQGLGVITFGTGSSIVGGVGCVVTGPRYNLNGGNLEVQASGAYDFIPGTVNPTVANGGKYIPLTFTKPTPTSCGTSPSTSAESTDSAGTITVGTGGPTHCTLPYSYPTTNKRTCTLSGWSGTNPLPPFSSQLAASFTFGDGATNMSGVVVSYQCNYSNQL